MADDRARRKPCELAVRDPAPVLDPIGHPAEARPSMRPTRGADARRALGGLARCRGHPASCSGRRRGAAARRAVVRRTRSRSPRWTGTPGGANSRSRWRQPPHGAHSSALGAATTTSAICPPPPATRADRHASAHWPAGRRRSRRAPAYRRPSVVRTAAPRGSWSTARRRGPQRRAPARRARGRARGRAPRRRRSPRPGVVPDPEHRRGAGRPGALAPKVEPGAATASSSTKRAQALDVVEVDPHVPPRAAAGAAWRPRPGPRVAVSAARSASGSATGTSR